MAPDMPTVVHEPSDDKIRPFAACPIMASDRPLGVLNLDSQTKLEFSSTDTPRLQGLSAFVEYEVLHLQRRFTGPSPLSKGLGHMLRSAREELKLTQDDLAALVGTSRIALSRWEAGVQPPSRGPLQR